MMDSTLLRTLATPVLFLIITHHDTEARRFEALTQERVDKCMVLTVIRLGLPIKLFCSLASADTIESMSAMIRQICNSMTHWREAKMALFSTVDEMPKAAKDSRQTHKQPPILKSVPLKCQEVGCPDFYLTARATHT